MHSYMLFFTNRGRCYWLKVYDIPEGAKNTKGRAIQNLLNYRDRRLRQKRLSASKDSTTKISSHRTILCFATKRGIIKKTSLEAYSRPRANGNQRHHHPRRRRTHRCRASPTATPRSSWPTVTDEPYASTKAKVREMGRVSTGVRGMTLGDGDDDAPSA